MTPVCTRCGYSGDEVWVGNGPDCEYGVLSFIYFCPADRSYCTAVFDPTAHYAFKNDLEPPASWESRYSFQQENAARLGRFLEAWEPPAVLRPSNLGGWIRFRDGAAPGGILRLEGQPWTGFHLCPACGRESLEFVETGLWD